MFSENFYSDLAFMGGEFNSPVALADIKAKAEDFQVDEIMTVDFSGEGEHIWLQISKRQTHSDQIAKALAKLSGIGAKDVGISGMKDYRASTRQWFSVCLPGVKDQDLPDWSAIENDQIQINQVQRHSRKLKRGTHIGNQFNIVLRNVSADANSIAQRLVQIQKQGVPNYFGEQRFGRGGSNLQQAMTMLASGKKIKQRQKRSMLLSSARSWLFNWVLSKRLQANTWLSPQIGEPLNLSGSRQFFCAEEGTTPKIQQRICAGDVHTTAPLWGLGAEKIMQQAQDLHLFECSALAAFQIFTQGLEKERLDYGRRAMRLVPENLIWQILNNNQSDTFDLELSFKLGRGEFATSVLRELVQARVTG